MRVLSTRQSALSLGSAALPCSRALMNDVIQAEFIVPVSTLTGTPTFLADTNIRNLQWPPLTVGTVTFIFPNP